MSAALQKCLPYIRMIVRYFHISKEFYGFIRCHRDSHRCAVRCICRSANQHGYRFCQDVCGILRMDFVPGILSTLAHWSRCIFCNERLILFEFVPGRRCERRNPGRFRCAYEILRRTNSRGPFQTAVCIGPCHEIAAADMLRGSAQAAACSRAWPAPHSTRSLGKRTVTVVPRPGVLSTVRVPPCNSVS